MNNKIEIGFGVGLTKDFRPVEPAHVEEAMREIRDAVCRLAGGCTVTKTEGDWISPAGQIFSEQGRTVTFYMDASTPVYIRVRPLIEFIKKTLEQEAVMLIISPCNVYTI